MKAAALGAAVLLAGLAIAGLVRFTSDPEQTYYDERPAREELARAHARDEQFRALFGDAAADLLRSNQR